VFGGVQLANRIIDLRARRAAMRHVATVTVASCLGPTIYRTTCCFRYSSQSGVCMRLSVCVRTVSG